MRFFRLFNIVLFSVSLSLLAACDSSEERAEKHYEKGVELLEAGDVDRALIEFRNVFKLNGRHEKARETYAEVVLEQGKLREAFGQYLRLVEQHPENLKGNRALAEIAIQVQDWESATKYSAKAVELAPDDPRVKATAIALRFRDAMEGDDPDIRRAVLADAVALKSELPVSLILSSIIVDGYAIDGDDTAALAEIDSAVAAFPDNVNLYRLRLQMLNRMGDQAGVEEQLRNMVRTFPEDEASKALLIRYYMSRGQVDNAEEFLRSLITEGVPDDDARIILVQFLSTARGPEAARAELDHLIEEGTNNDRYRALRAAIDFDMGKRDEAIAEFQSIIAEAEPSEQTRDIKIILARFLGATGNEVGARALVEEVLAEDESQVEALKMQASWLIDADKADDAINVLRRALDQSPDDASIMTIMAYAHTRNGDRELAGEMLSLAAEASNSAPMESIRYAEFLASDGKLLPAEAILVDALRLSPNNLPLMAALGSVYIQMEDWPRAEHVERTLRGRDDPKAQSEADKLKLLLLERQRRSSDAIEFLEGMAEDSDAGIAAHVGIVRTHLAAGDSDKARAYLDRLLEEDGDNPVYQFLDAALYTAAGDYKSAEGRYRKILAIDNANERVWLELIRALNRDGRPEEAKLALNEALEILPEARDLLWAKASVAERDGDIDGAIAIYEKLYSENSTTSIVANNLASLLATYRSDDESLARAYAVARRLRGTEFPPFQDTYGWIAYRRGDYQEALAHLEPAAAGLPDDPVVQYHLGMAYLAMERPGDALTQLEKAVEMAGDDPRPEFEAARQEIATLKGGQ